MSRRDSPAGDPQAGRLPCAYKEAPMKKLIVLLLLAGVAFLVVRRLTAEP